MTRSDKYLLGIFFNVAITIFLVASLLGFVPMLSEYHRNILILIVVGKWLIEALLSINKDGKKDRK